MRKRKSLPERIQSLTYEHIWLRYVIDYGWATIISAVSALVFALGFNLFLAPSPATVGEGQYTFFRIISGGASGVAQTIARLFENFGVVMPDNAPTMYSIFYLGINIPLICLAIFGIGKRFGIFTLVNVSLVFLFTNIFKGEFINNIALFIDSNGGVISRALFAGLCTGFSSAIAYKNETSAGGLDIVFYYMSLRRNSTAGKYGIIVNIIVIASYSIITGLSHQPVDLTLAGGITATISSWEYAIAMAFFSAVYLVMVMIVIDLINVRNKKVQVEIITALPELPDLLLANIPHGATVTEARGAFSGDRRLIIYMVVSSLELKDVIRIVRELDPNSFVNVIALQQVYGRFFLKPVK